jgi:DNA-binding NarL/FixJ family response regulator
VKKSMLIVDDVAAIRSAVRAELESEDGFQACGEAENGFCSPAG